MKLKSFKKIIFLFLFLTTYSYSQWEWRNEIPALGSPRAIDALDSNFAVCSFSSGNIFKTTDGGVQWIDISYPGTSNIDISAINEMTLLLASSDGQICKSTDGGNSWEIKFEDSSKTDFMNYIEMFDTENGIAIGDAPIDSPLVILKTDDGGDTWNAVNELYLYGTGSADTWRRIDFVDQNIGYFFASFITPPRLTKTTDGGNSWNATGFDYYANILKFYDENFGMIFNGNSFFRTIDGGNSWEVIPSEIDEWGQDFEFIPGDPSRIWFSGYNLYFSSDSGSTWTRFLGYPEDLGVRDIVFTDSVTGWAICEGDKVLRTTSGNSIVTNVEDKNITENLPKEFSLSQNYPNPFNPTTKIKFTIPTSPQTPLLGKERGRGEVVTLKVYDILGNEVATLVNEEKSPGEYEIEFDASKYGLSSGVYFYQLKAGSLPAGRQGFVQTKKLVLIK